MRTTLDLPVDLLEAAMKASRQRTKTAVIIAALQDLVRKRRLLELKRFRGCVDIDADLSVTRKRS